MAFRLIDMENWPRREHYQYYTEVIKTSYQVDIDLDVTNVRMFCQKKGYRFYPTMIYIIMKAINRHENFRMALDQDGRLGIYEYCHPSYTIFHEDDHTFSDIWTEWHEDFDVFYHRAIADMENYKDVKGIKAKSGRPDAFIPISCVPWLKFKSLSHDTEGPGPMFFPVITFGKYEFKNGKWELPFSLFIHHAAADGYHTAMLFQDIQEICDNVKIK